MLNLYKLCKSNNFRIIIPLVKIDQICIIITAILIPLLYIRACLNKINFNVSQTIKIKMRSLNKKDTSMKNMLKNWSTISNSQMKVTESS